MEEFLKAMTKIASHWRIRELNERLKASDVSLNMPLLNAVDYLKKSDFKIKTYRLYRKK